MIKSIKNYHLYILTIQEKINKHNRNRLQNTDFTLICSNCAGGFFYHWLGLKFNSLFMNLCMNNEDFLTAMGNFDEFINGEIIEDYETNSDYPIGIGIHGERLHFMHYIDFQTAI